MDERTVATRDLQQHGLHGEASSLSGSHKQGVQYKTIKDAQCGDEQPCSVLICKQQVRPMPQSLCGVQKVKYRFWDSSRHLVHQGFLWSLLSSLTAGYCRSSTSKSFVNGRRGSMPVTDSSNLETSSRHSICSMLAMECPYHSTHKVRVIFPRAQTAVLIARSLSVSLFSTLHAFF